MSERDISAAFKTACADNVVYPVRLVYLDFLDTDGAEAPIYLSTDPNGTTWNSITWSGHMVGLLEISDVVETTDGSSDTLTITLDGIASEVMARIEGTQYQHRTAEVYLGLKSTASSNPIADPFLTFSGTMDSDSIFDDGVISTLQIQIVSQLTRQLKPLGLLYTHNDQQLLWPDDSDSGLEFLPELQGTTVKWGPS